MLNTTVSILFCCSSLAQVGLTQVGLLGKTVGTYMDSQWGLAQFSVPNETPCLCAFVGDKKSVVGKHST